MNGIEFLTYYNSLSKSVWSETTEYFNSMTVSDRKWFLQELSRDETRYISFIDGITSQAKKDFWIHERELIRQGRGTREWTPDQIETIMNISSVTGEAKTTYTTPKVVVDGKPKSIELHHMFNKNSTPELAGEWKNLQPLTRDEHFIGLDSAHAGNTRNDTSWCWDYIENQRVEIKPKFL